MALFEKVQEDLKSALKARMMERVDALRLIVAVFRNREIEKRGKGDASPLSDHEVLAALRTEGKKRKEAIDFFLKGDREEQAAKEKFELAIIESYLPSQLSSAEVSSLVSLVVAELKPTGVKDFGRLMKELVTRAGGRADSSMLSELLKRALAEVNS